MKAILFLTLLLIAAQSQTLWDNWHNVPTTWVGNGASNTYGLTGWKRNGIDGQHFSGSFKNYSQIYTQYMYWKSSSPNTLILCGPKYYLSSESLCRVNPYFKTATMSEYCVPNYFNYPGKPNVCTLSIPLAQTYGCCYENGFNANPSFIKNINSIDTYSTAIFWTELDSAFIYLFYDILKSKVLPEFYKMESFS
jgi:hypothetical protein